MNSSYVSCLIDVAPRGDNAALARYERRFDRLILGHVGIRFHEDDKLDSPLPTLRRVVDPASDKLRRPEQRQGRTDHDDRRKSERDIAPDVLPGLGQ